MDKRLTDAKGKPLGFIRDSGGREIVTDANGAMKGHYDARNHKTYTQTGALVGTGDQRLALINRSGIGDVSFEVLPDVISPSFDQYLHLSPDERRRRDELHWRRLINPQRLAFLARLLKASLSKTNESRGGAVQS